MKSNSTLFLAVPLALALALPLAACGASDGDRVERFAEAAPSDGASIAVPGYEALALEAGKTTQAVQLENPAENACTFAMSLTLGDGEVIWQGEELQPGEAFTRITLSKALDAGEYPATLHYDCFSLEGGMPLNGADIELTLEVK